MEAGSPRLSVHASRPPWMQSQPGMAQDGLTPPLPSRPTSAPAGPALAAPALVLGPCRKLPQVPIWKATESSGESSWGLGEGSMGSGQVPSTTTGALRMSPSSGASRASTGMSPPPPCHQGCLPAPYGCVWSGSCPPNPPSPAVSNGRWGDPGPSTVPAHSRCLREVSVNTSLLPLDPTGGNGVGRDQQSSVLSQTPSRASLTAQISCYDWNVTSGDVSPQPCK